MRALIAMVLMIAVLVVVETRQPTGGEFSESFENPGSGNNYGFAGKSTPIIPSGRTITHRPTSGFDGTGAAEVEVAGCTTDCSSSTNQGNVGWFTPALGGEYAPDATIYVRFRFKLLTSMGGDMQKFIIFGGPLSGNRVMHHLGQPYNTNGGCHPSGEGNDYYRPGGIMPNPIDAWLRAADFGLPSSFQSLAPAPGRSHYAAWTSRVNIGWNCDPFVIVPNRSAVPDIKAQKYAEISDDGWNSIVFGTKGGPCGNNALYTWVNNNDQARPTTQVINSNVPGSEANCDIPTSAWGGSMQVGGYWGQPSRERVAFLIDDFGVSRLFPATFYRRQGNLPTPTPTPPPPVNCVTSDWSAWVATTPPSTCTNGEQLVVESRSRTVVTAPSNGGLACGPLSETRTVTQTCTVPVPPVTTCPLREGEVISGTVRSVRETVTTATLPQRVAELQHAGWLIVGTPSSATVIATTTCPRP